jgi:hypothetical protein
MTDQFVYGNVCLPGEMFIVQVPVSVRRVNERCFFEVIFWADFWWVVAVRQLKVLEPMVIADVFKLSLCQLWVCNTRPSTHIGQVDSKEDDGGAVSQSYC